MLRLSLLLVLLLGSLPLRAEVQLLVSIRPLQLIAAAVQDGVGTPAVLLPGAASPHHYALRPSDVRRVREAQLLYWIGPDLESFLPRVLQARKGPSLALQTIEGLQLRHFGEGHERGLGVGGDRGLAGAFNGQVIRRYAPQDAPKKLAGDIEAALTQG